MVGGGNRVHRHRFLALSACARLIIYQSMRDTIQEPIYHPTLVGSDFFVRIGAVFDF